MIIMLACINLVLLFNNILVDSILINNIKDIPITLLVVWEVLTVLVGILIYSAIRIGIKIIRLKRDINE